MVLQYRFSWVKLDLARYELYASLNQTTFIPELQPYYLSNKSCLLAANLITIFE